MNAFLVERKPAATRAHGAQIKGQPWTHEVDGYTGAVSMRDLSEQLVIAPLTVKKAYDELEALGYIGTQRGRGTYVAARLPRGATAAQASQLEASARGLVSQAYLAGLQLSDVIQLIKDADREISAAPGLQPRKEGRQR